jgi:DNA topoisomerase IA
MQSTLTTATSTGNTAQKYKASYYCTPGERIMKLAEELYQAGFISYPRTETDRFDPAYDLRVSQSHLIDKVQT